MSNDLHKHYDKLSEYQQEQVDEAYRDLQDTLREAGCPIAGDDTAERVVDAIARGILETAAKRPTSKDRKDFAEFLKSLLLDKPAADMPADRA